MSFLAACGHSKTNEDLKQQNSELEEKLRVLVNEKAGMQLRVEELQKKLEMSELLLQQVRPAPQGARAPSVWGLGLSGLSWVACSRERGHWILVWALPWNPARNIDQNLQVGARPRSVESGSQGWGFFIFV